MSGPVEYQYARAAAFPSSPLVRSDGEILQYPEGGVTKREYFAALAMQGYLAGRNLRSADTNHESAARACIEYADALLQELAKEPPR